VNLVGNALKFTEQGEVRVSVSLLRREDSTNWVRFDIRDSGIGMSEDALSRLFQKFEQADVSTTRRFGGTGLGLAITRQLVELMGGGISVASVLGQGSTFSFQLPLPDGQLAQDAGHSQRAMHTHRLRVLCAEDFPTNQVIIQTLLEDMGHVCTLAENGKVALQILSEQAFDLILMDGRMPEMDGVTATVYIRSGGKPGCNITQRDIPIIALTANAGDEDRQKYLASGMDDFISKPIDEAVLHDKLALVTHRLLERGEILEPMRAAPAPTAPAQTSAPRTVADLDALFGVEPDAPPATPSVLPAKPVAAIGPKVNEAPGGDLKARMKTAFIQHLPTQLMQLDLAMQAGNAPDVARIFHGIRGSVGFLERGGALHLLCGQLEQAADRNDWPELAATWPRAKSLLAGYIPSDSTAGGSAAQPGSAVL
jgi:CheY-like chemotaxis protein